MNSIEQLHPMPTEAGKKKRSLFALLTIVFLSSYGLMTLLIVEQGETIQSQRNLIRGLLADSRELWAGKARAKAEEDRQALVQIPSSQGPTTLGPVQTTETLSTETPSTQAPSTQAPSTQVPVNQTPSTQRLQEQSHSRYGKAAKPENLLPEAPVPPMPASDLGDQRRVLIRL